MAYLGNDLQVAYNRYTTIDNISTSFNGTATSFSLLVNGVAPIPFPINSQQCLISVGGVLQQPDDTGVNGFRLSGTNIIFSSAPAKGESFFGVILAGSDYVTAGASFPDGSALAPSITFDQDTDTGFYRGSSGSVSYSSNGTPIVRFDDTGVTALTTGAIDIPVGTTAQRPASSMTGMIRFNTTNTQYEGYDGTVWGGFPRLTLATAQNTTSGTSIDFTGIPSWVKRVTVMFNNVSTNAADPLAIQLGTSSGFVTAAGNYNCGAGYIASNGTAQGYSATNCFIVGTNFTGGASNNVSGHALFTNVSGNIWVMSCSTGTINGSFQGTNNSGGTISLPGVLDRLRLSTTNGTSTFDAGSVNILYEG